jgi:hypothetical protein
MFIHFHSYLSAFPDRAEDAVTREVVAIKRVKMGLERKGMDGLLFIVLTTTK